jgi:exodeoxyribonuclease VII large subunit
VIITSPTGAAIRDMMNVLARRNRMVPVTLVPTIVQGESAAPKIIEAFEKAWKIPGADVIIMGRGGGSIEDMWCFNDEALARVIARSPIPVISAVGHEIDFTIGDFVADVRAPTPSAAAELVVKNVEELERNLLSLRRMLMLSMEKHLRHEKQKWQGLSMRLVDPKRRLQDLTIRRDELTTRLQQSAQTLLRSKSMRVQVLRSKLISPEATVQKLNGDLHALTLRMKNRMQQHIERCGAALKTKMSVLDTLSPLRTVDRGYSVTRKGKKVITSIAQVTAGDRISIRVADGEIETQVLQTTNGGPDGL